MSQDRRVYERMKNRQTNAQAIYDELEATRTAFHALLDSLIDADWEKKTANPSWNVRELMWHMAESTGLIPQFVAWARKGKGPFAPRFLIGIGNDLRTRRGAKGATRQSVRELADKSFDAAIACLDTVKENEWQDGADIYGSFRTIEMSLHNPAEHFKEHSRDILKGLGR